MSVRYEVNNLGIIKACQESHSMTQAAFVLGLPFNTFRRKAKQLNVYKPNQGGRGWRVPANHYGKGEFVEKFLCENSPAIHGQWIKKKLLEFGLKQNKCEDCGQKPEWKGKPLVLQLDHKNGIKTDNRLDNIRILCPNCHTQTETFSCKPLLWRNR